MPFDPPGGGGGIAVRYQITLSLLLIIVKFSIAAECVMCDAIATFRIIVSKIDYHYGQFAL